MTKTSQTCFSSLTGLMVICAAIVSISACSIQPVKPPTAELVSVFTVKAEGNRAVVRVLTHASACPNIEWDGKAGQPMALRASPATTIPVRSDSGQADSKSAVFDVRTCESEWPVGAARARVANQDVPAPRADIKRIVIVADTGCRMKASENAFQPCNEAQKWPFAQVASSAAALKPDLVIHIGDIHYRESPCPAGNTGCANSPWGYGFDTWQADFFKPAQPLLKAAPWVFVRGNHESCFRAGQGWFRFFDPQTWREARSCNDPQLDNEADYSAPYAVPIAPDTQLVVFDSAKTSGKPMTSKDVAYGKYMAQMKDVDLLTQQKAQNLFTSHHPLLAFAPVDEPHKIKPGGSGGLQSVFGVLHPERLFPDGVSVAMHGHVHLFEAISFKSKHPTSLVMGNSGSANEGSAPHVLPEGAQPFPGAVVEDYAAQSEYGFATLDRVGSAAQSDWLLTEYNTAGKPMIRCDIRHGKSRCKKVEL
jgi:Calcineurin-like phosphoesterase